MRHRRSPDPRITTSYLHETFTYDPRTGVLIRRSTSRQVGAGSNGQVDVLCRKYITSHIIWKMMTGEWPEDEVDHKNRVNGDNRWDNLRPATRSENCINRRKQQRKGREATSQYMGVKFRRGRWQAYYKKRSGESECLGYFDTDQEAARARDAGLYAEFGEYAVLNFPKEYEKCAEKM